jgi:UDP-galactopyranose mutase
MVICDRYGGLRLPTSALNYGTPEVRYTRSIEYAHFPNQIYDKTKLRPIQTVLYHETSSDSGEPYYPVPNPRNADLYRKYQKMAYEEKEVVFVGRLASYKYFDMDDAVRNALNTFEKWVKSNNLEGVCDLSLSADYLGGRAVEIEEKPISMMMQM